MEQYIVLVLSTMLLIATYWLTHGGIYWWKQRSVQIAKLRVAQATFLNKFFSLYTNGIHADDYNKVLAISEDLRCKLCTADLLDKQAIEACAFLISVLECHAERLKSHNDAARGNEITTGVVAELHDKSISLFALAKENLFKQLKAHYYRGSVGVQACEQTAQVIHDYNKRYRPNSTMAK